MENGPFIVDLPIILMEDLSIAMGNYQRLPTSTCGTWHTGRTVRVQLEDVGMDPMLGRLARKSPRRGDSRISRNVENLQVKHGETQRPESQHGRSGNSSSDEQNTFVSCKIQLVFIRIYIYIYSYIFPFSACNRCKQSWSTPDTSECCIEIHYVRLKKASVLAII